MDAPKTYLMIFKARRENFVQTMTAEEKAVMEQHAGHCRELAAQGKVVLLGVCPDGAYGVLVFQADSEDQARGFFDEDPAVKAQVVHAELHPFLAVIPHELSHVPEAGH